MSLCSQQHAHALIGYATLCSSQWQWAQRCGMWLRRCRCNGHVPVNHAPLITTGVEITCRYSASATDKTASSYCAVNLRTPAVNCRHRRALFDVVSCCCFWYITVLIFKSVELTDLKLFSFRRQVIEIRKLDSGYPSGTAHI